MKIVFCSCAHIGDVYFSSLFINNICKYNDLIFYYYFIQGDIFFNNIKNLKRFGKFENEYRENLNNGSPPEDLLNNDILSFVNQNIPHAFLRYKLLNINNESHLFINTLGVIWHSGWDINSAITAHKSTINDINKEYNINLKYNFEKLEIGYNLKKNYKKSNIKYDSLKNSIFIFNYKPRSYSFNMEKLNNFIKEKSIDKNVIIPIYDSFHENNKNITFCDKTFNILPVPSCENLLYIWEIAKYCSKIFIISTGSSWTYLHILDELNSDQIYMIDQNYYANKLTKINKYLNININVLNINI